MVDTLREAGVIDDQQQWIGGATHLVIVGDILDRGPDSRAAMELLMRLEGEADVAGGKVHVLFGNHESMPMTGDMRYVSDEEYAAFAADEDQAERDKWFELFAAKHGGAANTLRATFDKEFPNGYFAMRRAFRADGRYGEWLLEKNFIVVINGTAFVHGGLPPLVAEIGLQGINGQQKALLRQYVEALAVLTDAEVLLPTDSHYDYHDILTNYMPGLNETEETLIALKTALKLNDLEVLSSAGPLWYRGSVACSEMVEAHRLQAALSAIDAKRVVVGHTPTPNRKVLQRYDGRLIEIDTGMLGFYYKGSGNALVLEGDSIGVVNQNGAAAVKPLPHPRRVGYRSKGLTTESIAEALRSGTLTTTQSAKNGAFVTVNYAGNSFNAVFTKSKGRGIFPEAAAYRLDRLLGLDMVPVTVIREVDGKSGTLQYVPPNRRNEAERAAAGEGYGAHCPIQGQWEAMYLFDALIYNTQRTQQSITYDRSSWQLILTSHTGAFTTSKAKPPHLKSVAVDVNPSWQAALTALSDEVIEREFADVLDAKRRRALSARRDRLLASVRNP